MIMVREEMARMDAALRVSGEMFTDDFEHYRAILDTSVPVLGQFSIDSTPPGFPPEEIREDWVGLSLPVRFTVDIEQIPEIPIMAAEALHALEAEGRTVACDWWRQYYVDEARKRMPNVDDQGHKDFLANISLLVFDSSCGTLRPDSGAARNELIALIADPFYPYRRIAAFERY